MAKQTFKTLMRRLSQAGFKKEFVHPAILPDWWDETCRQDSALLPELEIRIARFLELPVTAVATPSMQLATKTFPKAQLRKVKDIDRDRLAPAIHAGMQIAGAVVRSLRATNIPLSSLPSDGRQWRAQMGAAGAAVTLDRLLSDLWSRGIVVVPVDILPAPTFQGMACLVEGRPVILLGHRHEEPGRVAFLVAHEAGHIAAGDCAIDQPVVDEDEAVADDDEIEKRADRFARSVVGTESVPPITATDYKDLARQAAHLERTHHIDAGLIIFTWASRTRDYGKATMAVKALYRSSGARRLLRNHFDRHVDTELANETDRALLRCVYGEPESTAAVG